MAKVIVDAATGCWQWHGCKDGQPRGDSDRRGEYGRFALDGYHMMGAHRAAYLLFRGSIQPGHHVCHRCDVPSCVNPDHLFLGTLNDNMADQIRKGRAWFQKPDVLPPRLGTGVGRSVPGKGVVVDATCCICGTPTVQRVSAQRVGRACVCPGNSQCKAVYTWRRRRGHVA